MAKKSMINRELKRDRLRLRYAAKREELKELIRTTDDDQQRREAQVRLQALPRDACPIRGQRRCRLTGRPHGVYRKFGLGRNKLRELTMTGDIPGLHKSSW